MICYVEVPILTNHRIYFGLEGTLTTISYSCHGQGPLQLDQVAQDPIQSGLEHSRDGLACARASPHSE